MVDKTKLELLDHQEVWASLISLRSAPIISHMSTTGKVTLLEGRLCGQSFYRSLCCFRPSI